MAPGEALGLAAQVAVALAGFAGVVVVFRSGSVHDWSSIDKFRLRLLLADAIFPLVFCMFGSVLLAINPPPVAIWRWCSGFTAIFLLLFAGLVRKGWRSLGEELKKMGATWLVFYPVAFLGTAMTLLQLYNIVVLNAFWPFYAAIVFQLVVGMVQFARFILLPPHSG
jgi:hypothetical protein